MPLQTLSAHIQSNAITVATDKLMAYLEKTRAQGMSDKNLKIFCIFMPCIKNENMIKNMHKHNNKQ